MEVFALPIITFTALADICVAAGVQAGQGGATPQGGIYSGTAVTDDGNGLTYSFDPAAAGVGIHTITYTYTDANGCTDFITDDVEVFALPILTFTALADLCVDAGVQAGQGGATPQGGIYAGTGVIDDGNGLTYSFDPAAAGVGVHTITYTYTDANGCTNSITDDVEVFALPVLTFTALADLCVDAGIQAGQGGATPQGGIYSGTAVTDDGNGLTYSFDPAAAGVGVHTITYTFTDGNGCTNFITDDVEVFALPILSFIALPDICVAAGVQAGQGGATPAGGVYSGTGVTDDGNGLTYSFDPAAAGVGIFTLTYTYTDPNGCTEFITDDVEVYGLPNVEAGPDQVVCEGTSVTLTGSGAVSYVWDNGVTDNVPFTPAVGSVTYTVTGTDSNGCSATDIVNVLVQANPVVSAEDVVICIGEEVILYGQGADYYEWSGGVEDGEPFYPTSSGVYTVTGYYLNGCFSTSSANVTVNPNPFVDFDWLNTDLSTNNPTTEFDNLSIGAVDYVWFFGEGSSYSYEFEPFYTFPNQEGGGYYVTLTGTSEFGCESEITKYIEVGHDYSIYVPNAFTPDANGVNEIFKPILFGFDEFSYTLYVFNRWGELIFESHDMDVGWDGYYAGDAYLCQDGVYTWKIFARVKNTTESKMFVGHVNLLK